MQKPPILAARKFLILRRLLAIPPIRHADPHARCSALNGNSSLRCLLHTYIIPRKSRKSLEKQKLFWTRCFGPALRRPGVDGDPYLATVKGQKQDDENEGSDHDAELDHPAPKLIEP